MTCDIARHQRYFERCLLHLPSAYQSEDCQRLAIAFFAIKGLSILNTGQTPRVSDNTIQFWVDQFIRSSSIGSSIGFGGPSVYDGATVSNTFFALSLIAHCQPKLRDDGKMLSIVQFLESAIDMKTGRVHSQNRMTYKITECDPRQAYMLIGSLKLVQKLSTSNAAAAAEILLKKLESPVSKWLRAHETWDGGFAMTPDGESHAGFTFCAIAALSMIGQVESESIERWTRWLVFHLNDDGGFCGRFNKPSDVCYSFWVGFTLKILNKQFLIDTPSFKSFILKGCQHNFGGFAKNDAKTTMPDIFHSFTALAALTLLGDSDLALSDSNIFGIGNH